MKENKREITLIALIISIIVLVILAGVAVNTLYGENGIITTTQDVAVLSNIKSLEESIDLYKISKNLDGKVEEDSYPIALNEDGSWITLSQMKNASELAKLPDEVKYTLLNLTTEKGTTNIPSLDQIEYNKFYKLDYTKLNISEEEAENLVIYVEGDTYKVINLSGVKYKKNNVYVIIPLNNEAEPEYITVANNTYKLYGDGTLKVLGEKTTNSGYTSSEVNTINSSWDEFDLKAINARFDNRMNLPDTLTSDWYASNVYFSTGTAYVIDDNKDLWAWGANDYNKLGLGHSFLVVEPTKILEGRCEGKENVKAEKVWAGANNTFVVDQDGTLWACGTNGKGTLGQANFNNYTKWMQVDYINGKDIKEITIGIENSIALIVMNNGDVYGAGQNTAGVLGGSGNKNQFVKIEGYKNVKQIDTEYDTVFFIDENDVLYGCGSKPYFETSISIENPVKIAENVKQIKLNSNWLFYITNEDKLYVRNSSGQIISNNIKLTDDAILSGYYYVISSGILYRISQATATKITENAMPYYNNYGGENFIQNKRMAIYKSLDGKIYVGYQPNITRIGEKSNYNLRKVFENALYVNGNGNYITIVDRNGKIYESTIDRANDKFENAKKIIASQSSKYILKNDGTLWAKGSVRTGMFGENISANDYVQVTKDRNE